MRRGRAREDGRGGEIRNEGRKKRMRVEEGLQLSEGYGGTVRCTLHRMGGRREVGFCKRL